MAILVDSSVWIGHLHKSDPKLVEFLVARSILIHPAVLGEISAGNLKNRSKILGDLKLIPRVAEVSADEVLDFIEVRKLFGKGLSWVDIQLLASCLAAQCSLYTHDLRLENVFEELNSNE